MRILSAIASFGAFLLLIAVGGAYISSFGLYARDPEDRINLSMEVPDVKGIVVGSRVLLRGAPVGMVTSVSSAVDNATIDFYVEGRNRIPVDSDVRLDNLSALGEGYVGFIPRTDQGPILTDGQRISTERIVVPPSISQLATTVVRVLNQMDPAQLKRILDESDIALQDPDQVLPNLSRASLLTRNVAVGMNGKGRELLDNFQVLLRNASWVGPDLAELAPSLYGFAPAVAAMWNATANAVAWNNPYNMERMGEFLARIQAFLDDRAPDLKVIGQALTPQMQGISGALMNFDTGQILSNMLSGIPEEGAVRLHVTIPER